MIRKEEESQRKTCRRASETVGPCSRLLHGKTGTPLKKTGGGKDTGEERFTALRVPEARSPVHDSAPQGLHPDPTPGGRPSYCAGWRAAGPALPACKSGRLPVNMIGSHRLPGSWSDLAKLTVKRCAFLPQIAGQTVHFPLRKQQKPCFQYYLVWFPYQNCRK